MEVIYLVVFYNENNENIREVIMVEHDVISPTIPANRDINGKIEYYNENNMSYVSLPYEIGGEIFNYNLCFNNGEFIGLVPIQK
jgi:hypothetical protein